MTRRRYALIEQNGERQCVLESTLDGHPDATVIAKGIPHPPEHHRGYDVKARRWIPDGDAKALANRHAKARGMSRLELVERIEALERRIGELEKTRADQ
jgi:hypothetical protein